MRNRFCRRACVVLVSMGLSCPPPRCPRPPQVRTPSPARRHFAGGPGQSEDNRLHAAIISRLHRMTLEEKVGQLFVVEVFGHDANAVTSTAAARSGLLSVSTPLPDHRQVQAWRRHLLRRATWAGQRAEPAADRDLVQRSAEAATNREPIPLLISTDQEGGSVVSTRGWPRPCRATWRSAPGGRPRTPTGQPR